MVPSCFWEHVHIFGGAKKTFSPPSRNKTKKVWAKNSHCGPINQPGKSVGPVEFSEPAYHLERFKAPPVEFKWIDLRSFPLAFPM